MRKQRTAEEYILLSLSGILSLAILPFWFVRFAASEWTMTALDSFAIAIMMAAFAHVYVTGKTNLAGIVVSVSVMIIVWASVYVKGQGQLFWAYPALVATFFLVTLRLAAVIVSVFLVAMIPVVLLHADLVLGGAFYLTVIANSAAVYAFVYRMQEQQKLLSTLAIRDPLTGAGNRRAMEEKLVELVDLQNRRVSEVSLIFMDLDNFKAINDKFGHSEGDEVLVQLAKIVAERIRSTDTFYRYGGEEFVVLAENTNVTGVLKLAEELRTAVQACKILQLHHVSISSGCAQYQAGETGSEWVGRADAAMFQAKDEGRNLSRAA